MSIEYSLSIIDWEFFEETATQVSELKAEAAEESEIWSAVEGFDDHNNALLASVSADQLGAAGDLWRYDSHGCAVTAIEAYESVRMKLELSEMKLWDCFVGTILPFQFTSIRQLREELAPPLVDLEEFGDPWVLSPNLVADLYDVWASLNVTQILSLFKAEPVDVSYDFTSIDSIGEYYAMLGQMTVCAAQLSRGIMISPPG